MTISPSNPLLHILQKEKIAPEIVNVKDQFYTVPLQHIEPNCLILFLRSKSSLEETYVCINKLKIVITRACMN